MIQDNCEVPQPSSIQGMASLLTRDENSFALSVVNLVKRMKESFDLTLLR